MNTANVSAFVLVVKPIATRHRNRVRLIVLKICGNYRALLSRRNALRRAARRAGGQP
jgi:hypothetical protein